MDMLKDAICHELRGLLGVLEASESLPMNTRRVAKIRRRINKLCDQLDIIDLAERAEAAGRPSTARK